MWLTRLALKYPISTFLAACTVFVLGVVSFFQLPVDLLPNITIPVVSTITFYTGAGPMDMEQTVTAPIERAVTSVNDVSYVQSVTREGNSQIRVFFNWGANVDVGVIDITQHVNRILTNLPAGISPPIAVRFDLNSIPICNIAVSGDMDQRDMYDLAYNVIEPQIEHISGIAYAQVIGGRIREIHVTLDRDRIEAMQIPIQEVLTAVSQSNLILPSGDLKTGRFDFSLKTESQFNLVEPMKDIIVKTVNNVPIRLKDIGTVEDSYIEQSEVVRVNQKPGITLRVQKLSDFNTVEAVDNVIQALPHLYGVPSNIHLSLSFDQSQYIRQSISGLQREAIIGALLAIIVIVIFLRNIRGTIIIFVAIPLSILITFIVFRFGGITLNIMTFGGLALGVGRLVDDSIVELEAITRHYGHRKQGENKMQATLAAAQEVAGPIFISTLTTVIVFLPVVFMTGIAKLMFIPLTITIAVALFGSFFVSRTVTPSLCYKFLPPEPALDRNSKKFSDRMRVWAHDMLERLDDWYEAKLRWALNHRRTVILGIIGVSVLSLGLFKFIGTEFFPDQDESQMNLTVKAPVGTREEVTEEAVKKIEQLIKDNVPEVNTIISDIGVPSEKSGNLFSQNTGEHAATIQVSLVPAEQRKRSEFDIVNELRPKLSAIPGVKVFANPGGLLHFLLNFGSAAPIDVEIHGYDLETGTKLSKEIVNIVKSVSGTTDVQSSREDALPELRVTIDRDKAGVLGLNVQEISTVISTCINGTVASIFTDPKTGNEYNILVRLNESYRSQIDDLKKLAITTPSGGQVELGNVANIEMASSPVEIDRKYQQRLIDVTANVYGRDLGSAANEIQQKLNGIIVPSGFEVKLGGNVAQQKDAFTSLLLAFGLAIMLVYVVMASQFQSLLDPFIIMFTVPLGIVGVLWMLFLTNTTLSVTSFEGIIVMVGIVVSNGILLVDYTNHLRFRGTEINEAVVTASRTRLKPILMTTLATLLGLIPMALGMGGEDSQAPLAIAVIGGLTLSTGLTLFFVPSLYVVFEQRFKRKHLGEDEMGTTEVPAE